MYVYSLDYQQNTGLNQQYCKEAAHHDHIENLDLTWWLLNKS